MYINIYVYIYIVKIICLVSISVIFHVANMKFHLCSTNLKKHNLKLKNIKKLYFCYDLTFNCSQ